jgi:hypothetical protein
MCVLCGHYDYTYRLGHFTLVIRLTGVLVCDRNVRLNDYSKMQLIVYEDSARTKQVGYVTELLFFKVVPHGGRCPTDRSPCQSLVREFRQQQRDYSTHIR